jgi:hypothetical protein
VISVTLKMLKIMKNRNARQAGELLGAERSSQVFSELIKHNPEIKLSLIFNEKSLV